MVLFSLLILTFLLNFSFCVVTMSSYKFEVGPLVRSSGKEKEIVELLELARSFKVESEFQMNSQYRKFKEKYTKKTISRNDCHLLVSVLAASGFKNECIYWYETILKEIVCTSDEHYEILCSMSYWHVDVCEYESAIEYGLKALEITNVSEEMKPYWVSKF